jgi:hypothetical protein
MKYGSTVVVNGLTEEMKNFVLNVVTMSNDKQQIKPFWKGFLWDGCLFIFYLN